MRNEEWDDFSARLNYYLASKGYESMTTSEMMDIIWQELRSKATEDTLMEPLRRRDVAAILKLRFVNGSVTFIFLDEVRLEFSVLPVLMLT